jgi:hypothetical protein
MSEFRRKLPKFIAPVVAGGLCLSACGGGGGSAKADPASKYKKVGYDVSYPQAGENLPSGQSFGIVGVNGGNAGNFNSALSTEYQWAQGSKGNTSQPKASFYVWGETPGPVYAGTVIADWPKTGTNKYGTCKGAGNLACSFQYGLLKGQADIRYLDQQTGINGGVDVYIDAEGDKSTAASNPGTWQQNSANNVAAIEGFAKAITNAGDTPGIYSDSTQWDAIVGGADYSSLSSLPEWEAGGGTVEGAATEMCGYPFIQGAKVAIAQYIQGPYPSKAVLGTDLNFAC